MVSPHAEFLSSFFENILCVLSLKQMEDFGLLSAGIVQMAQTLLDLRPCRGAAKTRRLLGEFSTISSTEEHFTRSCQHRHD